MTPPALLFFLKIVLVIWGFVCVWFDTNYRTICKKKYVMGILIEIALIQQIALDSTDVLTILIFKILF